MRLKKTKMKTINKIARKTIIPLAIALSIGTAAYSQNSSKTEKLEKNKELFTYNHETEQYGYYKFIPGTAYFTCGFSKDQSLAMNKEEFNNRLLSAFEFTDEDFKKSDKDKDKIITDDEIINLFKNKYSASDLEKGISKGNFYIRINNNLIEIL